MKKIITSLLFIAIALFATDDTYVFEAKGEFAKELKALVEKYSKEGKIEAKVYQKSDMPKEEESKTATQSILSIFTDNTAEELKYADIAKGERIYKKTCIKCHGANAEKRAYNTSRPLNSLTPMKIVEQIEKYQLEDNYGGSMRFIMKPYADNLSSTEYQSVAVYIYSLNHDSKLPTTSEESTQTKESDEKPSSYLQ
jgi:cytochrome c553